jgi:hypothetical protein
MTLRGREWGGRGDGEGMERGESERDREGENRVRE